MGLAVVGNRIEAFWFCGPIEGMLRIVSSLTLFFIASASVSFGGTAEEAWYGIALRKKAADKNKAFQFVENNPSLPNLFIYGDSISIAYTPVVRDLLEGKANVYRLHVNGGDSSSFVSKMDTLHATMQNPALNGHWVHEWDVVQVNVGLHDLKYIVKGSKLDKINGKQVSSLDEYEKNLEKIIAYLGERHPRAKLVFALTTPVPEGEPGRHAGDAAKYNKVALKVLKNHPEIVINDLYSFTKPHHEVWWTRPGNVHFNKIGIRAQGEEVARVLEELLD